MKILIVEDDELAADFIEKLIKDHFPDYVIGGRARSVKEASRLFNAVHPDVLIMDINLGDHNSFELFDYIDPSQLTVLFISSYQEFALRAIKVDAVDYLMKPIRIDEFKTAMKKAGERLKMNSLKKFSGMPDPGSSNKILIYENERFNPVSIDHIIKIRSDGAYSNIYLTDKKKMVSSKNLGLYEKLLEDKNFIRIHDSCVINCAHLKSYNAGSKAYVVLSDGSHEAVSKTRKRGFLSMYR